jgi:hypothetical protein
VGLQITDMGCEEAITREIGVRPSSNGGVASCSICHPTRRISSIEEAFNEIESIPRRAQARTCEALVEALGVVISTVTARDICEFFEHCGYGTLIQSL